MARDPQDREWRDTTLADVASDVAYGYTESATDEKVGPHFLRITDIQNGTVDWDSVPYCPISASDHAKYKLEPDDIVVARTGNSTGENFIFRADTDAVFASYLIRFRIDHSKACPLFVWYCMRAPTWWSFVNNSKTGSAQAGANAKVLGSFPLTLPPLHEQQAIAEILGSLDDKIELNQRMNRALEQMARAIFKAWFIDFEPVKAKAEGATRYPGMPQYVFDQLPDQLVETELGLIPKGWEVRPLGDVLDITMGQSPPSEFYNEICEGLPFHQGVRDYGFRFPKHRVYCTLEARIAHEGDVLLSVRAPVGRINVADRRLVIGRGLAAARHPDGCSSYALYLLKHIFAEEDAVGDGTIYKAITKKFLFAMPVVCPSDGVVMEAERLLDPVDALLGNGVREIRVLAEMRDTLLPKLISGELRVSENGEVNHGG